MLDPAQSIRPFRSSEFDPTMTAQRSATVGEMPARSRLLGEPPVLQVLLASTRPGRVGAPIATWFLDRAAQHGAFSVDLVDLRALDLPLMDEPNHPRLRQYTKAHTHAWSDRVDGADAFVFVMPEYNHGFNAPLKNAIDYLHHEWKYKPLGLVTYGGVSAGTRAGEMIKQVVLALKMQPLNEAVSIPFVAQFIDAKGDFEANAVLEQAAKAMLDELVIVSAALRTLRSPLPDTEDERVSR